MLAEFTIVMGYLAALVTSLAVLAKFTRFSWVLRRLVVAPITEWLTATVYGLVSPMREENARDHAAVQGGLRSLGAKVDHLGSRVDSLSDRLDDTNEELGLEVNHV